MCKSKRGGGLFQPRLPQNAVISAFFNAFLSMIRNDSHTYSVRENHVATALSYEFEAIVFKHCHYLFNSFVTHAFGFYHSANVVKTRILRK